MSKFLDKTGLDTLWAKIKSTFQTLGNLVTAWGSTPSDTKYPSEKLVKTSLDAKATDSDVVHKTGTETVSGAKTFSNTSSVFAGKCASDINGATLSSAYGVFRAELGNPTLEERGIIEETFANQLECLSKEKIVYETSPKGTETWTTLAVSDFTHNLLWGGNVTGSLNISKTVDFRITINAPSYCYLNFLYFYGTGNGATFHIKLERKLNISGAWSVVSDTAEASIGWPGHNTIRHSNLAFNPTAPYQYGQVRLTLYIVSTGNVESYPTYHIDKFRYYGGYPYKADPWIVKNGSSGVTNFPKGVTSGVAIPVSSGGTGATTAKGASYNINAGMNSGDSDGIVDTSRFAFNYASPSATTGGLYYRTAPKVWDWIKGKISSVLGLTETAYGGNAATATTATTAAGYTSGGAIDTALQGKVDKETGKGLSTNDYTTTEKNKLAGIAAGAEVNVQSDWNQTTTTADDYIKNKPSLATVATSGSYSDLSGKPDTIEWATYGTTTYDQVTAMLAAGNLPCARYGNEVFKYYMYASRSYKFMSENMTYVSVDESDVWSYGNDYPTPATIGAVPTSRTVNGKALSSNISLSASDVGALPAGPSSGDYAGQSAIAWCIKVTRLATSGRGYAHITVDLSRSADGGDFGCVDIMLKADASDYYTVSYPHVRRSTDAKQLGQVLYANAGFMSVNGVLYLGVTCHGWSSQCSPRISSDMMNGQFTVEFGDYHASVQSSAAARTWFPVYANYNGSNMAAIGSDTIPVYIDQYGQVTPGKNRIQAVSNLNTSTMDSEVLYVL